MSQNEKTSDEVSTQFATKPKCGIVMPIAPIDGCTSEHWGEVLNILKDVILTIDFEPNLVSDADDVGIIQKRIIQNLYNNDIVVCDVSAKNPNVMFELGMRLAFDKPTIIIKDDKTDYTFDTSMIEHLTYPRDLRFTRIVEFKESLKNKITGTFKKSQEDPNYSTFLKNFGQYKIAHLQETEVTSNEFILKSLSEIKNEISSLKSTTTVENIPSKPGKTFHRNVYILGMMKSFAETKKIKDLSDLEKHFEELFEFIKGDTIAQRLFQTETLLKDTIYSLIPF